MQTARLSPLMRRRASKAAARPGMGVRVRAGALALAFLLDDAVRRNDAAGVARRADLELRFAPNSAAGVYPMLRTMSEDAHGQAPVVSTLATRPPWRASFLD